jgi:8-oxo-dGTP pyrophosphatase MutT (NUDIX family)
MLNIIYAQEPVPNEIHKSIFLAGPSLRPGQEGISWRVNALKILELLEYDGIVFVPEARAGNFEDFNYETQILWETKCLSIADNIIFYINRRKPDLLGLTTNQEFGYWADSGKCILITEVNADSVRYQEWWAKHLKMDSYHELFNGLKDVIGKQTDCRRVDGERFISQEIWKLEQFQSWYRQMKCNGNWISDAKILHVYRTPKGAPFAFSLWVNIFIKGENRYKNNEFIFSRPDISSCLLYYWRPNPMDCEIVLVSEFRSPVNNAKGLVYELPGGSSVKPGVDPKERIIEELHEETGFDPRIDKLEFESDRQVYATLLTHKCYLYSYKLDRYELDALTANQNKIFGNEADTERTELHVMKLQDAVDQKYIDWSNMGQILYVLNKNNY